MVRGPRVQPPVSLSRCERPLGVHCPEGRSCVTSKLFKILIALYLEAKTELHCYIFNDVFDWILNIFS